MKSKNKITFAFFIIITIALNSLAMAENSYTGQWDSNIYNLLDHPKTVALRVEVLDSETRLPLEDVQVLFKGTAMTEERTSRHPDGEQSAQEKEFELSTRTGKDGIAIVALGWQKEYPWSYGIDEIEKVQLIEIVRRGYHFVEQDTPFKRFLDVGQNKDSDSQEPRFFNVFEETWAKECSRSDVKFCTLRFSKNFSDLDNKNSTQSEFFEKIRNKEWGIVYEEPINRMQWEDKDQRFCGPYLIYTIRIYMDRVEDGYLRRESKPRSDNYQKKYLEQISDSPLLDSYKTIDSSPKISKKTPQRVGENSLETVTDSLVREMGLPLGTKGVAVKEVIADSDATKAGITPNIVIESIDSRIILDVEMLISKIAKKRDDDQLLLGIWKKKSTADWERKNLIVYVSDLRSLCKAETLPNKHIQDGGNRTQDMEEFAKHVFSAVKNNDTKLLLKLALWDEEDVGDFTLFMYEYEEDPEDMDSLPHMSYEKKKALIASMSVEDKNKADEIINSFRREILSGAEPPNNNFNYKLATHELLTNVLKNRLLRTLAHLHEEAKEFGLSWSNVEYSHCFYGFPCFLGIVFNDGSNQYWFALETVQLSQGWVALVEDQCDLHPAVGKYDSLEWIEGEADVFPGKSKSEVDTIRLECTRSRFAKIKKAYQFYYSDFKEYPDIDNLSKSLTGYKKEEFRDFSSYLKRKKYEECFSVTRNSNKPEFGWCISSKRKGYGPYGDCKVIPTNSDGVFLDGWNQPIQARLSLSGTKILLTSSGPDKKLGTADDIEGASTHFTVDSDGYVVPSDD